MERRQKAAGDKFLEMLALHCGALFGLRGGNMMPFFAEKQQTTEHETGDLHH